MKDLSHDIHIELIMILIVIINIFIHIIPVVPLIIGMIALSMFRTGLIGAFVLSSYALPILLGSFLSLFGITKVATGIEILLFLACAYHWLIRKDISLINFKHCFLNLILILLLYITSALITTGGDYAFTKIKDSLFCGFFTLFAFSFLFSNPEKCNYSRVGLYLILYAFLMLLLSPLLNSGTGPSNVFDFGYLRVQNALFDGEEDSITIGYQHVGFIATMGCGIILMNPFEKSQNNLFRYTCIMLCLLASLYSGARQFVIVSIILLIFWVLFSNKTGLTRVMYWVGGIVLVYILLNTLFSEEGMLHSVSTEGYLAASERELVLYKGVLDFLQHPIIGVGFGRFYFSDRYGLYPHNMFVEILCELGLVGAFVLLILVYRPIKQILFYQKTCLYLLIVFFLRSMVSGGLDSNMILFSFIFATSCIKNVENDYYNTENQDQKLA